MFVFNDSELDMSNIEPSVFAAGLDTKSQTCKWIPNGLFTYNITLPFTLSCNIGLMIFMVVNSTLFLFS